MNLTASANADLLMMADDLTGPDYCHVCRRATEHYGEHSDEQLLAFANSATGRWMMGEKLW